MAVHSQVNGTTAIPWRTSRRKLSLLEKLRCCQDAWCPKAPWDKEKAHSVICGTPAGSFLVLRDSVTSQPCLLCVSSGGEHEACADYEIKCTGKVFQLPDSRLSFSDLAQLVLFYSFTRDVLPVCLSIPHWIYGVNENKDCLSQREPKMWLSDLSEQEPNEMTHKEPNTVMCSIQLTSTNGALCVINPLYVHEHGDDWLTSKGQCITLPSSYRRERRLSSTRQWSGAGLQTKRAISLDQESAAAITDNTGLVRARSADLSHCPQASAPPSGVVLRRPSKDSALSSPYTDSLPHSSSPGPSEQRHSSPLPQSPHRVSWIEDGVWLPPPRPSSLLYPPSLELDSLSISSIEEEQEPHTPTSAPQTPSAHRLANKVKNRISAVGQVLGGLVSQKKRLNNRVQEMSERRGGAFAESVKVFVETTLQKEPDKDGLTEYLQEVRSSLTSLRETLLDCNEIQILLESITDINDSEMDSLVEQSLHKVALKPVSSHLYSCIQASHSGDSTLESNLHRLRLNGVDQLGGSAGVGIPDAVTLERIQQKWAIMHKAYSPNRKVEILLKVCKTIYHSMSANAGSGVVFGADDFLPCLTWVLLRSDVITLQVDTDYMMELLDPTQLQGEGGYYLTTLYASLYYISSFRPRLAARQLSVEAQHSLNQWHRRRTMHCDKPRRSKLRQTIKRQSYHGKPAQNSGDVKQATDVASNNCADVNESQQAANSTEALKEEGEDTEREGDVEEKIAD